MMCGEDFCEHFDFSQKVSGLLQDFRECVQDLLAQYGDIQIPIFYNRRWTSKAVKRFLTFPKKVSILQRMCATYIGPPETFKFQFWEEDKTVWRLFWLFPRKFRNFLASVKNVQINFLTGGGQHKSHVLKIIFLIIFTFPKKVLTVFFQDVDNTSPVKTVLGSFSQITPKEPLLVTSPPSPFLWS